MVKPTVATNKFSFPPLPAGAPVYHGPRVCWFPNCRTAHRAPSADQANPGKKPQPSTPRGGRGLWYWTVEGAGVVVFKEIGHAGTMMMSWGERRSMWATTAVPAGFSVSCRILWFFLVSSSNFAILSYIHIHFTYLRCTVQFESNIQSVVQPSPSSISEHFQKSPVPNRSHFPYASTSLFQVNIDTLPKQNISGVFRGYFPRAGQEPTLFWNVQRLKTLACWIKS